MKRIEYLAQSAYAKQQTIKLSCGHYGPTPFVVTVGSVEYRHSTLKEAKADYLEWVKVQLEEKLTAF